MNESVEAGSIHDRTVRSEINSIQERLKLLELPILKVTLKSHLAPNLKSPIQMFQETWRRATLAALDWLLVGEGLTSSWVEQLAVNRSWLIIHRPD